MRDAWLRVLACAVLCLAWGCGSDATDTGTKKPNDGGTDANASCGSGKADCDGNQANGCEVDTTSDEQNCGACGMNCGLSHATSSCESGSCQLDECDADYADCDGDPKNGCETFSGGDPANCGACGTTCESDSGAATCTDGKCDTTSCQAPLADCDGDPSNGCEVTTNDDPANCGACDNACEFPHAAADCEQSTCEMGACDTNYADCDNTAGNGCEIDTQTSLDHCGACDAKCGDENATATCQSGQCQLVCDTGYDNCDNDPKNGCEANLSGDVNNCGGCGTVCAVPTVGAAACVNGVCGIVGCPPPLADCDGLAANGCETDTSQSTGHCGTCGNACVAPPNASASCAGSTCGVGQCNAGFGDCNGQANDGCEADTNTDVQNCGSCNSACSFPNAGATCSSGSCGMGTCDTGFSNCNGLTVDGCEADTTSDPNHCGSCGIDCDDQFPNSTTSCNAGGCQFTGCSPGFYDIDGNVANGCEYACTFQSASDLPDDAFVDANCDGIDGDVASAVFVATNGNDSNPGTKQQPMQTVPAGIGRASITGKTQVYISNGTYIGRVNLVNAISLYGGYSAANNWARSAAYVATIQSSTVTNGYVSAMVGTNITSTTTVDRLSIHTGNTSSTGISNYALHCAGCGGLRLRNNDVDAGNAGPGTAGFTGTNGSPGSTGNGGLSGSCDDNGTGASGGPGGTSACGRNGGNGGKGGNVPASAGANGGTGAIGTPGGNGGGVGDPGGDGGNGQPGANGGSGANGGGASGGGLTSNFWISNAGGTGTNGTPGNGGGGGGGGGAQSCTFCNDGYGNGGGGGGGAGCAGTAGGGGSGGGGSFGVFLVNSTGVQLVNNTISSGNGGNGGAGGVRGAGGIGANGGPGGTTCTSEIGQGGNGGKGGNGGNGGYGGGGAGGPSYALYRSGTSVSTAGNSFSFGSAGSGGPSSGNAGSSGAAGAIF